MASLIWRLDHRQLSLSERTAVILDEVGMTDDLDLVHLSVGDIFRMCQTKDVPIRDWVKLAVKRARATGDNGVNQ